MNTIAQAKEAIRNVFTAPETNPEVLIYSAGALEQMRTLVDTLVTATGYEENKMTRGDIEEMIEKAEAFEKSFLIGEVVDFTIQPSSEEEFQEILAKAKARPHGEGFGATAAVLYAVELCEELGEITVQAKDKAAREIIEVLKANGGMYLDDHRRTGELVKAQLFGIYKEGDKEHAFIGYTNSLFCINRLALDEQGRVHLTTWSVGGNVRMDKHPGNPAAAIVAFNESCRNAAITDWQLNA